GEGKPRKNPGGRKGMGGETFPPPRTGLRRRQGERQAVRRWSAGSAAPRIRHWSSLLSSHESCCWQDRLHPARNRLVFGNASVIFEAFAIVRRQREHHTVVDEKNDGDSDEASDVSGLAGGFRHLRAGRFRLGVGLLWPSYLFEGSARAAWLADRPDCHRCDGSLSCWGVCGCQHARPSPTIWCAERDPRLLLHDGSRARRLDKLRGALAHFCSKPADWCGMVRHD